jgi:hypothetical protein
MLLLVNAEWKWVERKKNIAHGMGYTARAYIWVMLIMIHNKDDDL